MSRPWGDEIKARVRVAMEYGDRTWDQIAAEFGISTRTIQRWLHEDSASGEARRERLAQMCGVPPWFMAYGFAERDEDRVELEQRIRELEQWRDEEERRQRGA